MTRTQMWDLARIAQTRACPECGVQPSNRCVSLRGSRRDPISLPHGLRYPAGNRRINDPVNAAALSNHAVVPDPATGRWLVKRNGVTVSLTALSEREIGGEE